MRQSIEENLLEVWWEKNYGPELIHPEVYEEAIAYKLPVLKPRVGDIFQLDEINCENSRRYLAQVESLNEPVIFKNKKEIKKQIIVLKTISDENYKHFFEHRHHDNCCENEQSHYLKENPELYFVRVNSNYDPLFVNTITLSKRNKRILEEHLRDDVKMLNTFHGRSILLSVKDKP